MGFRPADATGSAPSRTHRQLHADAGAAPGARQDADRPVMQQRDLPGEVQSQPRAARLRLQAIEGLEDVLALFRGSKARS